MTVSSTPAKAGPFTGNDSTTEFDFSFKVFTSADLVVTLKDEDDDETELTETTHYTVALNADQNANPGGTVTYPASGDELTSDETLTLSLDMTFDQQHDVTNQGGFYPESHEDSFDKGRMIDKQLLESTDRTLKIPISSEGVSTDLPLPEASTVLGWNADADGLQNVSTGSIDLATPGTDTVTTDTILDGAVTTAKLADGAVTYAKIQEVSATDKVLGRETAGAGVVEEIDCTAAGRALIDDADAAAQRATLGITASQDGVGTIITVADETPLTGSLECDGSAINRTTYAALFAVIGVVFGVGNGSTTFNIPDLQGQFIRGWDNSAGTDPDAGARTGGDAVGSTQVDAFKAHIHTFTRSLATSGGDQYNSGIWAGASDDTSSTGGNETRPINMAMMYCIVY